MKRAFAAALLRRARPAGVAAAEPPVLALVLALLIAGCSSSPQRAGFYQDDGPPERIPADLMATPDAVPRDEPLHAYANRPYVALGHTYMPMVSAAAFRQRGVASWYGRQFQGNRTASGEPYDMFAMTGAHPTLPIPSYARVTNLANGRSVVVRINDRGPFLYNRIIDLSYAAAVRLDLAAHGSGEVEVVRVWPGHGHEALTEAAPAAVPVAAAPEPAAALASWAAASAGVAAAAPASAASASGQSGAPRWSVQLGAFGEEAHAVALRERLRLLLNSPDAASLPSDLHVPRIERQGGIDRVLVGEAVDRATAVEWSKRLERFLGRPTALFVQH